MILDRSDESWERIAKEHPYYGVLSSEDYRGVPDAETLRRFFASGAKHVNRVLSVTTAKFGAVPRGTAVDFGCGAGRNLLPLARAFERVIGLDIAPSMLAEAEKNCRAANLGNVVLMPASDTLEGLPADLALVHSSLVFQHIARRRGEIILAQLLDRLAPGGIAAVQLYVGVRLGLRPLYRLVRNRFSPLQVAANLWRGRPWREPTMQMNRYDANRLLAILAAAGIGEAHVELGAGGNLSLWARRPSTPLIVLPPAPSPSPTAP
jgi:SAM-dependent methyltransferase